MEATKVVAEKRDGAGKGVSRKIREKGLIPAVFYGANTSPISLSLDPRELQKIFSYSGGVNTLIELNIIDSNDKSQLQKMAILKDWQIHPTRRTWLHADLYEISADRPLVVNVPIRFIGKAKAIDHGGILEEIRREVSVECLPALIPDFIEVDVSEMDFGTSMHIRNLSVGEEIKILDEPDLTIATIMSPQAEVAAAEVAEEVEIPSTEEKSEEETE